MAQLRSRTASAAPRVSYFLAMIESHTPRINSVYDVLSKILSNAEIFSGKFPRTTGLRLVANSRALRQAGVASPFNGTNVHEDVRPPIVRFDKPVSLGRVEPLHGTDCHCCISKLKLVNLDEGRGRHQV